MGSKEFKILIGLIKTWIPLYTLGNVRAQHPRISRDTVLKPPTGREREGKKSHNQPSDLSPRHDFWLMMIYEILLIVTSVLSFQKWHLSSPCDCVIHEKIKGKLHFKPYIFIDITLCSLYFPTSPLTHASKEFQYGPWRMKTHHHFLSLFFLSFLIYCLFSQIPMIFSQ